MATYFGQQTSGTDDNPSGPIILWSNANYSCPGSGSQNIQELSIFAFGSGAHFRGGVYTTAGALVAEGTSSVLITGAASSWQGHMTQASVKAAGGVSPGVLTGGVSYKIAVSIDTNVISNWSKLDAVQTNYNLTDYTAGMVANLPAPGGSVNFLYCWRCGVDPAVLPSGIAPANFSQFPKPILRTPITAGRVI